MDNLLQEFIISIKGVMVHYRNNPEDKNLCLVACLIKNVITDNNENNSKILVQVLEENIPLIYLGKLDKDYSYFPGDGFSEIWQFICTSIDIMTEAYKHGETAVVYDISDMLQGIPDFKYWNSKKNMHSYWKCYIRPVKRKWKLQLRRF